MKKLATLFVLALFCTSLISAAGVEINLEDGKTEYYQSELLQAEILGTFLENLDLDNIAIYQGDTVHSSPLASEDLLKLENKYLYYAVLPSTVGNYTLRIEDIEYYVGQETSEETVEQNITITSTLDPYLSPSKGFIVATSDFSMTVQSLNAVQDVEVKFQETGETILKEIGYNSEKTFEFSILGIEEYTESSLEVGDYSIPVYVYPEEIPPGPFINETTGEAIDPEPAPGEEEPEEITYEEATTQQIQTCADLDAQICKKGEKCVGGKSPARDVMCCLGQCEEKTSTAWIWGILLLVILVIAGFWFVKKSKKAGPKKTEEQAMAERAKKYKLRMGLDTEKNPPISEVKKSLSRE